MHAMRQNPITLVFERRYLVMIVVFWGNIRGDNFRDVPGLMRGSCLLDLSVVAAFVGAVVAAFVGTAVAPVFVGEVVIIFVGAVQRVPVNHYPFFKTPRNWTT